MPRDPREIEMSLKTATCETNSLGDSPYSQQHLRRCSVSHRANLVRDRARKSFRE